MSHAQSANTQAINDRPHVGVLYGGRSSERSVSLVTGEAVAAALERAGYPVSLIDARHPTRHQDHVDLFKQLNARGVKVIFNALHGTFGEDGCLQGALEWAGVPYTGSGVKASAVAMDKEMSRKLIAAAGVPVARAGLWREGQPLPTLAELPPAPWAAKPLAEGSSVGIARCEDLTALHDHLQGARGAWLIEAWLEGAEVSVMVLDGEAWGGVEIVPSSGWYDYEAKYVRGDTTYHCPPRLPENMLCVLNQYAELAYEALGCRGAARVDFICSPEQVIALELNTSPGMTPTSLVPKVAAWRGVSFERLVSMMVEGASCELNKTPQTLNVQGGHA